jgi:hypothetical protein
MKNDEWTIGTLKSLIDERFTSEGKARELLATETHRRLDELNHAHAQAVEKERDFLPRETFEVFVERTSGDFEALRAEIRETADAFTTTRQVAAEALAKALAEQNRLNDVRFGRGENLQAKIVGGLILITFLVPIATGLLVYAVTNH